MLIDVKKKIQTLFLQRLVLQSGPGQIRAIGYSSSVCHTWSGFAQIVTAWYWLRILATSQISRWAYSPPVREHSRSYAMMNDVEGCLSRSNENRSNKSGHQA